VRLCGWCRSQLEDGAAPVVKYCGQRCRQSAWRLRQRSGDAAAAGDVADDVLSDGPKRFAYADPPYPGLAARFYRHEPDFGGEVDHAALIVALGSFDGWALSTSSKALRQVLPLCPPRARVCAWVKPIGASPLTYGPHGCWEPVIVVPGRYQRPGVRDWLSAQPARHGGTLPGRKPIAFCAWVFHLLGMRPGDELVDLFPGTGIVARSWRVLGGVVGRSPNDVVPVRGDGSSLGSYRQEDSA